jgi:hypothetical protein
VRLSGLSAKLADHTWSVEKVILKRKIHFPIWLFAGIFPGRAIATSEAEGLHPPYIYLFSGSGAMEPALMVANSKERKEFIARVPVES